MSTPSPPRDRRGFRVAIICALPIEAESVQSVFDICWEDEEKRYGKVEGDQNVYTTGVIGRFNVVLVHMPNMASTSASAVAAHLRTSYPEIKLALVVGICGAVPFIAKTQDEIFLGDIIISTAVIQYDFGRQYPDGFQRKKKIEDSLGRANPEIRAFINMLQTRQNHKRLRRNLGLLIQSDGFQREVPAAKYPGATRDRLYKASYIHQHRPGYNLETCTKSCHELKCEEDKLITRSLHGFPETQEMETVQHHIPSIHFGRFGSANTVMKSGIDRDRVAKADEVIAFEMEGAGVWEQHPTIVIKAACDYADSHKNKEWQAYAAAMAAACLKVFLKEWIIADQLADTNELSSPVWHMPFDRIPGFVGRTDELLNLKQKLFEIDSGRIVSVLGLGGVGKSRLALELAYLIKMDHPHHSVFWIQATGLLAFEKDMLEIGKKLRIPGIEDEKADIKNLVKQRLSEPSHGKWLLILDNADDETLWRKQQDPSQQGSSLVEYLPRTANGSILITTRARHVATFLAGKDVVELRVMPPDEAAEMFTNRLETPDLAAGHTTLLALLDKLAYLPLAIVQAAAFINMTQRPVQSYLQLLDQPEAEVIKLLSKDFGDQSRYPNAKNPVAATWLISFDHIRKHHSLAAKFLSSMACFHEKNIPRSLLPEVSTKIDMIDAVAILTGYSFITRKTENSGITGSEEFYDIHRLVQLAARNWLRMEDTLADWTKSCITRMAQCFPTRDYKNKSTWAMYLPHAQRLCEDNGVGDIPEYYQLLEKMGLCFMMDGKYDEAVKKHASVVEWRECQLGSSDKQTLRAFNNLGEALSWQGDLFRAKMYLEKAVDRRVNEPSKSHPNTLTSMDNLALVLSRQGKCSEAEIMHREALQLAETILGKSHPDTLASMNNLASTLNNQGKYSEAEMMHREVLQLKEIIQGKSHPSTLTSMNNVASTLNDQGKHSEAEIMHQEVLQLREKILGKNHPDTLVSMSNLAWTWRSQGRNTEAMNLMAVCVDLSDKLFGSKYYLTKKRRHVLESWQGFEGHTTAQISSCNGKPHTADEEKRSDKEGQPGIAGKNPPTKERSFRRASGGAEHTPKKIKHSRSQ